MNASAEGGRKDPCIPPGTAPVPSVPAVAVHRPAHAGTRGKDPAATTDLTPYAGEYLDLVAEAELTDRPRFDIGAGTGCRGDPGQARGGGGDRRPTAGTRRGLAEEPCPARPGAGPGRRVDMFPEGRPRSSFSDPPWLPGTPQTLLDYAGLRPSRACSWRLRAAGHLSPGGEGWLVSPTWLSASACVRREELLGSIDAARLEVVGRADTVPTRASADSSDPLPCANTRRKSLPVEAACAAKAFSGFRNTPPWQKPGNTLCSPAF